jgi:hypothetical protein
MAKRSEEAAMHIKTWHVELFIDEDERTTTARAVLHTEAPKHKEGLGLAVKAPHDLAVPEIGDEVAAARALRNLADALLETAAGDIAEIERRPVHLDFMGPSRSAMPMSSVPNAADASRSRHPRVNAGR